MLKIKHRTIFTGTIHIARTVIEFNIHRYPFSVYESGILVKIAYKPEKLYIFFTAGHNMSSGHKALLMLLRALTVPRIEMNRFTQIMFRVIHRIQIPQSVIHVFYLNPVAAVIKWQFFLFIFIKGSVFTLEYNLYLRIESLEISPVFLTVDILAAAVE